MKEVLKEKSFLDEINKDDVAEIAERLNFELYPNKGNQGNDFFKNDGFLHIVTWDHRPDCINEYVDNSLILHDYGILVGDPDKNKLDLFFGYMLEKFGDTWFLSAQKQFQGDKNAKNMILLNHIKEEFDAKLAEQNQTIETGETTPADFKPDCAPCDFTDMGL